jgi:hypothetical protein
VETKGSSLEEIEQELSPVVFITHQFKSCKVSSSCSEVSSSSSHIYKDRRDVMHLYLLNGAHHWANWTCSFFTQVQFQFLFLLESLVCFWCIS